MKLYNKNEKPFVYSAFCEYDRDSAISILQKINEDDVSFWHSEQFSKKEIKRIESAFSFVVFISNNSIADRKVRQCIEYAVKYNKKILCIYLEPTSLSFGLELLLNSLQTIIKSSFSNENDFFEKIKSAEVFSDVVITAAQKRFAKRRALASVFVPIASAVAIFFAVVVPLLIVPMVQAANGSLSKVGFGNLSLAELAKVEELYVIGTQSFDEWGFAAYAEGKKNEVFVYQMGIYLPVGDISDITDLSLLKNAKYITFEANQVTDISPLYKLSKLEYLTLNCNPIKSIKGIEALSNLRYVTLAYTEINDISPLFQISSLVHIDIEGTYVNSIEGIENLQHLLGLRTGHSNLTDISPLNKIDFSYINDTDGFWFEASESLIEDFSPLERIPKFREIDAYEIIRADRILPYIKDKQVNQLYLTASDIKTIEPLSSIRNMQILILTNSFELTSLNGIEKHEDLTFIELIHCPNIIDFTPLLKLPYLQELLISPDMEDEVAQQLAGANFEILYGEDGEP
ncbi:MAG: hypothetical protein KAQ68_01470 [Clostridiales bacterium]|nr:hypothetical protein [Clostridiales bacterium]